MNKYVVVRGTCSFSKTIDEKYPTLDILDRIRHIEQDCPVDEMNTHNHMSQTLWTYQPPKDKSLWFSFPSISSSVYIEPDIVEVWVRNHAIENFRQVSIEYLFENNFTIQDFIDEGWTVKELQQLPFTPKEYWMLGIQYPQHQALSTLLFD